MSPIRTVAAALAAPFESLGTQLSHHRGIARVAAAALTFATIIAFSTQTPVTRAGPNVIPQRPESLLPQTIGVGIPTDQPITLTFDGAMNPGTVEPALQVLPNHPVALAWSDELNKLTVSPESRWRTDETYVLVVGGAATRTDGRALGGAARYTFTTETAPAVTDVQIRLADVGPTPKPDAALSARAEAQLEADARTGTAPGAMPPTETAESVSASTTITLAFSTLMDGADVQDRFAITPAVEGDLAWVDGNLVFTPSQRLAPGGRYTVSVVGSHDVAGNVLGGKGTFSFIVREGAQVTKTVPETGALDVQPASVELWFSEPMDMDASNAAFGLRDSRSGALVGGNLTWNEAATQLTYVPDVPFAAGVTFDVSFDGGARDTDGNVVEASLSFTTPAAIVQPAVASPVVAAPRPVVPAPAPATSLAGYALNQVNAARAAYGFAPLVLDAGISAAASAHAWDQATNGYFSHYGRDGSTRESRLRAAGVSFRYSGENQCYHMYMSERDTLDWCHAQFMAEPYPGQFNHIGNILDPRFTRMGIGIATVGNTTVITWDFTD